MTLGLSVQKKLPREQKAVFVSSAGARYQPVRFKQEDGVRTFTL